MLKQFAQLKKKKGYSTDTIEITPNKSIYEEK